MNLNEALKIVYGLAEQQGFSEDKIKEKIEMEAMDLVFKELCKKDLSLLNKILS